MNDVRIVLGGIVGLIVALTLLSGGKFSIYTGPTGPGASIGYSGAQSH